MHQNQYHPFLHTHVRMSAWHATAKMDSVGMSQHCLQDTLQEYQKPTSPGIWVLAIHVGNMPAGSVGLQAVSQGEAALPKARLHFAHAETLLPLTSLLGLFGAPGAMSCTASCRTESTVQDASDDACPSDWQAPPHPMIFMAEDIVGSSDNVMQEDSEPQASHAMQSLPSSSVLLAKMHGGLLQTKPYIAIARPVFMTSMVKKNEEPTAFCSLAPPGGWGGLQPA